MFCVILFIKNIYRLCFIITFYCNKINKTHNRKYINLFVHNYKNKKNNAQTDDVCYCNFFFFYLDKSIDASWFYVVMKEMNIVFDFFFLIDSSEKYAAAKKHSCHRKLNVVWVFQNLCGENEYKNCI